MLVVHHRVNTAAGGAAIPSRDGAEVDLRTSGRDIVLAHEPFEGGQPLEAFLDAYGAGHAAPLILNVKEDLLEGRATDACLQRGIENFFFLDCAFPTLVRLANDGFRRLAVRVSAYEPVEIARVFSGKVEWAWLDCFGGTALDPAIVRDVQALGYRVCLVSPELQGRADALASHLPLRALLREDDAVCTKVPDRWTRA